MILSRLVFLPSMAFVSSKMFSDRLRAEAPDCSYCVKICRVLTPPPRVEIVKVQNYSKW